MRKCILSVEGNDSCMMTYVCSNTHVSALFPSEARSLPLNSSSQARMLLLYLCYLLDLTSRFLYMPCVLLPLIQAQRKKELRETTSSTAASYGFDTVVL